MMRHKHRWGGWLRWRGERRHRVCIDGWCSAGQYRNGRVFVARPERRPAGALR